MKVYVVMRNDHPDAVLSTKKAAEEFRELKRREAQSFVARYAQPEISWRIYDFELDRALQGESAIDEPW